MGPLIQSINHLVTFFPPYSQFLFWSGIYNLVCLVQVAISTISFWYDLTQYPHWLPEQGMHWLSGREYVVTTVCIDLLPYIYFHLKIIIWRYCEQVWAWGKIDNGVTFGINAIFDIARACALCQLSHLVSQNPGCEALLSSLDSVKTWCEISSAGQVPPDSC